MADSALAAVQALDDQRLKLVDEFVRRAWNMWRSLTPSDWWNDAVAEGAAGKDGATITKIELTQDPSSKAITAGKATLSNGKTVNITIS